MDTTTTSEVKKEIWSAIADALASNGNSITIREGRAVELREPTRVDIAGTIDAPARWLEYRAVELNETHCYVLIDREHLSIELRCNENSYYGTKVTGRLEMSDEYKRFGINSGNYRTHFELAELIKMNRSYFESKTAAMKLVSELMNFKAKVDKEVEQSDNNRGDRRMLINQAVQHNLPEAFNLCLPVFKGTPVQTIAVEVYVDPGDLTCTLVSPEANDFCESARDALINDVAERIHTAAPRIVIIEK